MYHGLCLLILIPWRTNPMSSRRHPRGSRSSRRPPKLGRRPAEGTHKSFRWTASSASTRFEHGTSGCFLVRRDRAPHGSFRKSIAGASTSTPVETVTVRRSLRPAVPETVARCPPCTWDGGGGGSRAEDAHASRMAGRIAAVGDLWAEMPAIARGGTPAIAGMFRIDSRPPIDQIGYLWTLSTEARRAVATYLNRNLR
jgi:hypothetical protein